MLSKKLPKADIVETKPEIRYEIMEPIEDVQIYTTKTLMKQEYLKPLKSTPYTVEVHNLDHQHPILIQTFTSTIDLDGSIMQQ